MKKGGKGQTGNPVQAAVDRARALRNQRRREQRKAKKPIVLTAAGVNKLSGGGAMPEPAPFPPMEAEGMFPGRDVVEPPPVLGTPTPFNTKSCDLGDEVRVTQGGPMFDRDYDRVDHRRGRRSASPYDGRIVYDVTIERATDNARTFVRGLTLESAQTLLVEMAHSLDVLSVQSYSRREF